jgi:hypothetical protein
MDDEMKRIWKEAVEVISRICLEGERKLWKKSGAGVFAEIRSEHLPNKKKKQHTSSFLA